MIHSLERPIHIGFVSHITFQKFEPGVLGNII